MSRPKGFKMSEKQKKNICNALKGRKFTKKWKNNLSKAQYKYYLTHKSSNIGRIRSEATRKKISLAQIGKKLSLKQRKKISNSLKGIKTWNWTGIKQSLRTDIRHSFEYKLWRSDVFQRDNWTCQTCHNRGSSIEAHHIKSFAKIIKENSIKTFKQAIKCEELWTIDNGVTLCLDCHNLTKRKP